MSDETKMSVRKWIFGAAAAVILALFTALAAYVSGGNWTVIISVFGVSAATHYGAWMKQHPPENIDL